jgi:hypothetical protein
VNTNSTRESRTYSWKSTWTKKAEFQPLLYETLTAEFNLKKVRFDFRSKAEAIRRLVVGGAVKMKRK